MANIKTEAPLVIYWVIMIILISTVCGLIFGTRWDI